MKYSNIILGILFCATVATASPVEALYSSSRLIQLSDDKQEWMSESQILNLISNKVRFRDVTDFHSAPQPKDFVIQNTAFPSTLTHQSQVSKILPKVSEDTPRLVLAEFTKFPNRYYNSQNGKKSSEWLLNTIKQLVPGVNATLFNHCFPQSSVIVHIEGSQAPNEIVIISAHQDSINLNNPSTGRAPGADDDGSGTVTILEALRVFSQSNLKPKRSVEFHWYAGEEGGLLGSADVSKTYSSKAVVADLHFDMTGYPMDPPAVGIVTDYTDPDASNLVRKIVLAYTDLP
ncbi:hypothetical protein GGI05_006348, partial [Coemansia sp. RSA 2603]